MDDDLLAYYNNELVYLRELGADFAHRYPKVAARLQLESDKCEDPHVERLLEGFAFLTARVRQKLDDEYPEIAEALLGVLYPHYLRPLPSMAIAQFLPPPDGGPKLAGGHTIDRGAELSTRPVHGSPCQFRTVYPVTLWPIEVESARLQHDRVVVAGKPLEAVGLIQIRLRCLGGVTFEQLKLDRLRFYLDGEPPVVHAIHAALLNHGCGISIQGRDDLRAGPAVALPRDAIRPVGFEPDEGMFPYPKRSFPGYRLLQEYFAFPEKFLFFDLTGLERVAGTLRGDVVDLLLFLNRSPRAEITVDAGNFRLGCAPVVNLFHHVCEPIALTQRRPDYRVVPDVHRPDATEIYEIESVTSTGGYLDEPVVFEPFYALRHDSAASAAKRPYWIAMRRPSARRGDPGTEVYLSFVDPNFHPSRPATDTATVRSLCTNRNLPSKLPFGGDQSDFQLAAPAPVGRVRCVRKPTVPQRPPMGRGLQWRLITHLSLNHLSLSDNERGLEALRAILHLYDFADVAVTRQQIDGIAGMSSRRTTGRTGRGLGNAVCLGLEVELEFDESLYVGSGVFLFASVLERFLGLYTSINSFTRLVARVRQREGILKRWPPRAGDRTLL